MRKFSLASLIALVSLFVQNSSFACSVAVNQDGQKTAMIQAIANHYSISTSAIQKSNLSKVNFSFLGGLGADCSGLEQAILTSAFDFTLKKNFITSCRYRGVVIHKESDAPDFFYLNAEPAVCTNQIVLPTRPIVINPIR